MTDFELCFAMSFPHWRDLIAHGDSERLLEYLIDTNVLLDGEWPSLYN